MTMKKSELELNWPEQSHLLFYIEDETIFARSVLDNWVRADAMEHLMRKMAGAASAYQYRGVLDFLWVLREHGRQRAAEFVNDFTDDVRHKGRGVELLPFAHDEDREDWLNGTGDWAEVEA